MILYFWGRLKKNLIEIKEEKNLNLRETLEISMEIAS